MCCIYLSMERWIVMKKSVSFWQMGGFAATAVLGTLLHFSFDWTGGSMIAALFSAVNESIWEHLKLLFYPMILVAVVEYIVWGKEWAHFWCIKLLGALLGLGVIPVIYYTYTGISGVNADWFNIAIFFLAAAVVYWTETKLFARNLGCSISGRVAVGVLVLMGLLFTVFTFWPPEIPLFQDPRTGTCGF